MAHELKPRRKSINIPSEWFHLQPRMTLLFWAEVHRRCRKGGVKHMNLPKVQLIAKEIIQHDFKKSYSR
jgi:hypothetical protein